MKTVLCSTVLLRLYVMRSQFQFSFLTWQLFKISNISSLIFNLFLTEFGFFKLSPEKDGNLPQLVQWLLRVCKEKKVKRECYLYGTFAVSGIEVPFQYKMQIKKCLKCIFYILHFKPNGDTVIQLALLLLRTQDCQFEYSSIQGPLWLCPNLGFTMWAATKC